MGDARHRTAGEVIESHLELRRRKDLERDIAATYAADVVMLTCTGVFRGHDGVRACARELDEFLPDGEYTYVLQRVDGDVAFLVWTARSPVGEIRDGVDSFVIRGGRVVAQTIHYSVDRKN